MKSTLILAIGAVFVTAGAASAGDYGRGHPGARNINVNVNARASAGAYASAYGGAQVYAGAQTYGGVRSHGYRGGAYADHYGAAVSGVAFGALGAHGGVVGHAGPSAPFGYAVQGFGRNYSRTERVQVAYAGGPEDRGGRYGYSEARGGGGGGWDGACGCVPLRHYEIPFYGVRPGYPVHVRAPGVRISAPPVHAPSPPVYIQGPPIYVDAPPVYVAPPQIYVEAPDVHVRPSEVIVAPAEVHFTPAGNRPPCTDGCEAATPTEHPALPPHHPTPPDHGYRQEPGERGGL